MFSAAMRSGFSQMRMAKVRAPRISAFCTPLTAVNFGWATRVGEAVVWFAERAGEGTAMSLRGYCRTLSERMDCNPASKMMRLTTLANTGRRMKKSVNFIRCVFRARRSGVRGLGVRFVARLHAVVHLHGSAGAQTEDA